VKKSFRGRVEIVDFPSQKNGKIVPDADSTAFTGGLKPPICQYVGRVYLNQRPKESKHQLIQTTGMIKSTIKARAMQRFFLVASRVYPWFVPWGAAGLPEIIWKNFWLQPGDGVMMGNNPQIHYKMARKPPELEVYGIGFTTFVHFIEQHLSSWISVSRMWLARFWPKVKAKGRLF